MQRESEVDREAAQTEQAERSNALKKTGNFNHNNNLPNNLTSMIVNVEVGCTTSSSPSSSITGSDFGSHLLPTAPGKIFCLGRHQMFSG
jgi:hypothetical protein